MIPSLSDIVHAHNTAPVDNNNIGEKVNQLFASAGQNCVRIYAARSPDESALTKAISAYPNGCTLSAQYTDSQLSESPYATLSVPGAQCSYSGGIKGGNFNGEGTFVNEKLAYTGGFLNGNPHGHGTISF